MVDQRLTLSFCLNAYTVPQIVVCAILVAVLYVLDATIEDPWAMGLDEVDLEGARCETIRHSFLRERANAMSNVVFVCVGNYMIAAAVYDFCSMKWIPNVKREYVGLRRQPIWSLALGLTSIFAGVGSFAMHAAHGSGITGALDIASIYFLVWTCFMSIAFNTISLIMQSRGHTEGFIERISFALLCIWVCGTPVLWYWETTLWYGSWTIMKIVLVVGMSIVAAVGVSGSLTARYTLKMPTHEMPYLCTAAILLVVALFVWAPFEIFGNCSVFYVPGDSLFQLHALWHGTVSLAVLFMYLYFRSFGSPSASRDAFGFLEYVLLRDATRPQNGTPATAKTNEATTTTIDRSVELV